MIVPIVVNGRCETMAYEHCILFSPTKPRLVKSNLTRLLLAPVAWLCSLLATEKYNKQEDHRSYSLSVYIYVIKRWLCGPQFWNGYSIMNTKILVVLLVKYKSSCSFCGEFGA